MSDAAVFGNRVISAFMCGVCARDGAAAAAAWQHEQLTLGIQRDGDNCGLYAAITAAVAHLHGAGAVWVLGELPPGVVALLRNQLQRAQDDATLARDVRLGAAVAAKLAALDAAARPTRRARATTTGQSSSSHV